MREDYRTNLCQTVAESKPCHLANRCQHAHALRELRLDAAIALEKIPPDFKASLCDDLLTTGEFVEIVAPGTFVHPTVCARYLMCSDVGQVIVLRALHAPEPTAWKS